MGIKQYPKGEEPSEKDLKRVCREYEKNLKKLLASVGTIEHQKYVEREHELNTSEKRIRAYLGLYKNK